MFRNICKNWNIFFDEHKETIRSYRNDEIPVNISPNSPLFDLFAQITATEKFEHYLENRLNPILTTQPDSDFQWTDGETNFVEMVYAFHEQQSFNGGKISLQALSEKLARGFNISTPIAIYRTWNDIKARGKGVDSYLNLLSSGLIKKSGKANKTAD